MSGHPHRPEHPKTPKPVRTCRPVGTVLTLPAASRVRNGTTLFPHHSKLSAPPERTGFTDRSNLQPRRYPASLSAHPDTKRGPEGHRPWRQG
jgi:hypothetical protein